jgi:ribosome-associated protein
LATRPKTTTAIAKTTKSTKVAKTVQPAAPTTLLDFAHLAIDAIESKKGSDIVLLDMQKISAFTDYFLLCNGDSARQIKAIAEGVQAALDQHGKKRIGIEGSAETGWILLDYADLLIHVFAPTQRAYYDLEGLWHDAQTVVKIQ